MSFSRRLLVSYINKTVNKMYWCKKKLKFVLVLKTTYYAENFLGNLEMKTLTVTFNLRCKGFCRGEGEEGNLYFFLQ